MGAHCYGKEGDWDYRHGDEECRPLSSFHCPYKLGRSSRIILLYH